jgi:hypothetical protein
VKKINERGEKILSYFSFENSTPRYFDRLFLEEAFALIILFFGRPKSFGKPHPATN